MMKTLISNFRHIHSRVSTMPIYEFDEEILKAMVEFEGLSFQEAKLSYQKRKDLPTSAFCGPKRTYPAHDAPHIRNAIQRLMQHKPKGWRKILKCICARARRAKVESDVCKKAGFHEAKILKWFLKRHKDDLEFCEALGPEDFKALSLGQMMDKLRGWIKQRKALGFVFPKPSERELEAVKLESNIHSIKTAIGERMLRSKENKKKGCTQC